MRTGRGMLIVASLSLAASVTGCGGSDGPADQAVSAPPGPPVVSGTSQPPAASTARPTAVTGSTGPSAGIPVTGAGGAGPACVSTGLAASLEDVQGAAGHVYGRIVLRNTGPGTCSVVGYPGVSVVNATGGQVGAAADRTGPAGTPVTLPPGGSTGATLAITQAGLLPGCEEPGQAVRGANLRVYPPDDRGSLLAALPAGVETCRDPAVHQLAVGAFGQP
ncbi:DUF4232 domain-containing protein [Parafrankia sp. BMG5.11]|uniref:DUF4232 domain-containing protein n=2 Tax=unclassified Parafrankia TaxID=2994368 RepID=UPI000DD3141B|nr:DUF4232 domain-containing protein [Parafrankia sp. BMG5.11]TCJ31833.1 DUF4232 domain-containing protein [Parafrankia sp. BMG5.11]